MEHAVSIGVPPEMRLEYGEYVVSVVDVSLVMSMTRLRTGLT